MSASNVDITGQKLWHYSTAGFYQQYWKLKQIKDRADYLSQCDSFFENRRHLNTVSVARARPFFLPIQPSRAG